MSSRTHSSASIDAAFGVGLETPVDQVGDPPFSTPRSPPWTSFPRLELPLVIDAALAGVAELGNRSDMEEVIEFAVPSRVESMLLLFPDDASMGAVALHEAKWPAVGNPGDVTDRTQDDGRSDRSDPRDVAQLVPEAATAIRIRCFELRIWESRRAMSSTSSTATTPAAVPPRQ